MTYLSGSTSPYAKEISFLRILIIVKHWSSYRPTQTTQSARTVTILNLKRSDISTNSWRAGMTSFFPLPNPQLTLIHLIAWRATCSVSSFHNTKPAQKVKQPKNKESTSFVLQVLEELSVRRRRAHPSPPPGQSEALGVETARCARKRRDAKDPHCQREDVRNKASVLTAFRRLRVCACVCVCASAALSRIEELDFDQPDDVTAIQRMCT